MNNNFDFSEIQKTALKYAKDHPMFALAAMAIAAGISKGVAEGISKMAPTLQECWKYTVDRAVDCLPKSVTDCFMTDDNIPNTAGDDNYTETQTA